MEHLQLPALSGSAQWVGRTLDPGACADPVSLLASLAEEAAEDAQGGRRLLDAIDTIGLLGSAGWSPDNGPRLLGERLGVKPHCEIETAVGGEIPITLVNHVADRIVRGQTRVALIGGVHLMRVLKAAAASGERPNWPSRSGGAPQVLGEPRSGHSEREQNGGLDAPIHLYPLIENAIRARLGRGLEEHREALGRLFAPFTRVAAENPYAWFPVERSAAELTRISAANRMISYPYTKYLNAVLDTNQAAVLILCSAEAARSLGVPERRLVHWWGGAHTQERAWNVSERPEIGDSPALRECARRTLTRAGMTGDDLGIADFYSCFPAPVQLACDAYGISEDDPRGLTVTGGLPYFGGPGSGYPLHAIATMSQRLRAQPGEKGLTTGNGWYATKHSACVWSTEPPPPAVVAPVEARAEVGPQPLTVVDAPSGAARVASYTVAFGRDGQPSRGIVVADLPSGERCVVDTPGDVPFLEDFVAREQVGATGIIRDGAGAPVFIPGG